jgi:hypothetical protein
MALLKLVRESNWDVYTAFMMLSFWVLTKVARGVGSKAVSYVGEILNQSEQVRRALNEQLENANETLEKMRLYNAELLVANRQLRTLVDEALVKIAVLERCCGGSDA